MTVAAEAARGGWRGVVVTSLYDGWYGYPIRLTRIYGLLLRLRISVRLWPLCSPPLVRRRSWYSACASLQVCKGGHDPSSIFTLENGAGSVRRFGIAQEYLDSYDGPYLGISS